MKTAINVLDHGLVRLVDHMGSDLSIVRNARVSHNAEWRTGEDAGKDEKLIDFLYSNGHNTPFEAVTFTFEIKAPIFVIRQWHRHRTQSYNEVSARYTELPEEFYIPKAEHVGKQCIHNKQMREVGNLVADVEKVLGLMESHNKEAFRLYREMLEREIPRELARTVLPLGTYTHMFATMNLHNLFRFLGERLHPHAQWEIQQYAQAMLDIIEPIVPVAVQTFNKHR